MKTAYRIQKWEKLLRPRCLTLGDIRKLKRGDRVELVNLHRNILDTTREDNRSGKPYTAKYYFRNERSVYEHISGVNGKIKRNGENNFRSFTFEVEYAPGYWYPLSEDGSLPMRDSQSGKKIWFCDNKRKICLVRNKPLKHSQMPDTTLIGWRGVMLPWQKMSRKNTPRIFH